MKLYGLKTCDTCRKALKSLKGADFVDVRSEGVPAELMARADAQFGADLVNRRSTTWRNLNEEERQTAPLTLLKQHPTLMKRPLIETSEGQLFLGWGADVRAVLLGE